MKPGDKVKIIKGQFKGDTGEVKKLDLPMKLVKVDNIWIRIERVEKQKGDDES